MKYIASWSGGKDSTASIYWEDRQMSIFDFLNDGDTDD